MLSVEELGRLPARQYLERFHVEFYLRDALSILASRRRGDNRSGAEFMSQYLEAVLRGEHVLHRGFAYINSTPLNRRAFVALLRQGLSGVDESTALTAHDFHDLAAHVCSDLPLALVQEAALHAKQADPRRHHFLGESTPFALSPAGCCEDYAGTLDLRAFRSLHRLVEFCLVYAELLEVLRHMFKHKGQLWPPPRKDEEEASTKLEPRAELVAWPRPQLVAELRFYSGALSGVALPSEHALRRLLRPGEAGPLVFEEALAEMAEHFELMPETYPEELVPGEASQSGRAASDTSAPTPAAERRRRSQKPRGRN